VPTTQFCRTRRDLARNRWNGVGLLPGPPCSLTQTEISRFIANSPEPARIRAHFVSATCRLDFRGRFGARSAPLTTGGLLRRRAFPSAEVRLRCVCMGDAAKSVQAKSASPERWTEYLTPTNSPRPSPATGDVSFRHGPYRRHISRQSPPHRTRSGLASKRVWLWKKF
jgi:hypothetical protein